jgi:high affinity Mn2+ porin
MHSLTEAISKINLLSIIDQGAFDYAANAWGFTYGAAGEWYQDWWAVRAGVFDLSQAPNTVALSNGFGQGQFVAELEERHKVWGQPGKLKFLYWLTRGNLGNYLDAIALGSSEPGSVLAARHWVIVVGRLSAARYRWRDRLPKYQGDSV